MAKMKRKTRRFDDGGETYNPDQDIADRQANRDSMSFGAAFRDALKDSGNTFMWRGKRYTKEMDKPIAPRTTSGIRLPVTDEAVIQADRVRGLGPSRMTQQLRGVVDRVPYESRADEARRMEDMRARRRESDRQLAEGLTRATMGPIAEAGTAAATGAMMNGLRGLRAARAAGMLDDEAADMVARATAKRAAARKTDEEIAKKVEGASGRRTKDWSLRRAMSGDWTPDYGLGLKKGGKVKKYAKGGSIRGSGIERKGKTRGRFV
jgi:hypothetical protein